MEDYDIDDYGISEIFDRKEKELTESMMRNFDKHRAEEDEKGINWSQWQVEQLAALEQYKRHNAKKYKREFTDINKKIDGLIRFYRKEGNNAQEVQILEALKKGLNATKSSDAMIGKFFKLNDRKIDALIESLTNDFERCEVAMLRRANDQYRKIIFASQMYATMGGTYEKAVDMASKDFLRAGINNVEYKNGARHNMRDYADMAIRTACKRAYLTGEGEKRKEWGETLVIMNKRGNPCPKCFPWVGLILIDDVWSGGTADDGPYKLMSTAISEGLYHPRCKDSHSTYFPGITTVDEKTIEDSKRIKEDYEKKQKINYYKRQQEKCERIAEYSLDEDNKRMYQARADFWKEKINANNELNYLRNNLPKGFVDTRHVGDVISKEDLEKLIKKAELYEIRMTGFENYCGDIELIENILEHIYECKTNNILKNVKNEKIILNYDNVLGYMGDKSKIDIGAFAETRGKTVTLNKFMFDDSEFLKKEYEEATKKKLFAKGTSYINIVDHEYGHVLNRKNPKLYNKILDEIEKLAYNDGKEKHMIIIEKISTYAAFINSDNKYSELISELYSMAYGNDREFALSIFRKVGVLNED